MYGFFHWFFWRYAAALEALRAASPNPSPESEA